MASLHCGTVTASRKGNKCKIKALVIVTSTMALNNELTESYEKPWSFIAREEMESKEK